MLHAAGRFVVIAPWGLDGPQSVALVEIAQRIHAMIRIRKDDLEVDGTDIMGVMTLAADLGEVIRVRAEGEAPDRALTAIGEHGGLVPEP